MSTPDDLLKAVRTGRLDAVQAALDAGVPAEVSDGRGVPGLPLGIACFLGHTEIVRALVRHGAHVNVDDNRAPTSPLSMAIRGKHPDIVRVLIELGATVPPGMTTGLVPEELAAAQWIARHHGAAAALAGGIEIEEIVMPRALGTDTLLLEADAIQHAIASEARKRKG